MPSPHNIPRTWEDIAKAASEEKDPIRLAYLIEELSNALSGKQTKSPEDKSVA
jgi:hypothetical protein